MMFGGVWSRWCAYHRRASSLYSEMAVHPGHLPAQLPVGIRSSVGPGEPGTTGQGLGRWDRTWHHPLYPEQGSSLRRS